MPAIAKKKAKMIVKDGNGDYLQLLPETEVDAELDGESSKPVACSAVAEALSGIEDAASNTGAIKVMDEEPTTLNTAEYTGETLFAWVQPETWSITESIYDAGEYGQIPFCLYGIENASITIDWGDGTIEEYTAEDAVEHECPTHEYAAAGNYTITMESRDFSRIYLQVIFVEGSECPRYYLSALKSINSPMPKIAGVQGQSADWDDETGNYAWISQDNFLRACFFYASNLESIPSNLFENNSSVTDFSYCFLNCTSLQSIPSELFNSCTAAINFDGCFSNCTSLNDFTLHIGSSSVFSCYSFVTKKTGTTRTIYVPSGSTTQTTFNAVASTLGLTIIGE